MDLETAQTTTTAKLPLLKQGEYDIWRLRIEQYFQIQDYALWDVIDNGNSFKPAAQTTTNADGSSTTLVPGPVTTKEKAQKKNDVKARSMLLTALLNEHLMIFNQYKDAKTLFAAIQTRFGDKNVIKESEDRIERAATTASSLEVEQDSGNINRTQSMATLNESFPQGTSSGSGPRCEDTILGGADAQIRSEAVSKQSNDPPLSRVNTLGSGENNMKLKELMELCTKLSKMEL
ncbi:hypothetical protein Tco_1055280 [Tanacetum coccineum]|uniref:Uncharacterized protein n=1 Tax=Tanacetum coccineum TaxID=301880 RepID=A0ABQ5GZ55_9ASTR